MGKFIEADRHQYSLLPAAIDDWLPQNHLARFVVEAVEMLDLSAIYACYGARGGRAYGPKLMVSLLFYGYATGVFSSRKLEAASYDSVAFRYICGNHHPDHDTIATFRKQFLAELEGLFVQILLMARELGFGHVGQLNIDGTKIQANASKHSAMSYEYLQKLESQYQAEVARLLSLAEAEDQSARELDIPAEVARREERLLRLREAREVLQARAQADYEAKQAEYEAKVAARKEKEEQSGKKPRGPAPKPPTPEVDPKSQYNFTDSESRIMKTKDGFEQCYNAQAAVTNDMLVAATHLSNQPNDKEQLEPTLAAIPETAGEVKVATADTGYFSQANIRIAQRAGIDPYIATGRQPHNQWLTRKLDPASDQASEPETASLSPKQRMAQKLSTPEGKERYRHRKMTVEPVFGIIKEVMGFRRFSLRGEQQAKGEWSLVCTAYNLKRLFNLILQREKSVQATENDPKKDQNHPDKRQICQFLHTAIHRAANPIRSLCRHRPSHHQQARGITISPTGC